MLPLGVKEENTIDALSQRKIAMRVTLDMKEMQGKRYEDTYGAYLKFFEFIADQPQRTNITVIGAPGSWVALLRWMDCTVVNTVNYFDHDPEAMAAVDLLAGKFNRTLVEALCGLRPETVDALWKLDMQWKTERNRNEGLRDFIVTNNGSFHRAEVLEYGRKLQSYTPSKRDVVLVPCAADKPYPSPMHQAVMDRMPESFYLCNATGVLGLVPQDLWPEMPYYDSGIPNEWRLMNTVLDYFTRVQHRNIIIYCDFYNEAIDRGLLLASVKNGTMAHPCTGRAIFVNEVKFYHDYLDLMHPQRLQKLQEAFDFCHR